MHNDIKSILGEIQEVLDLVDTNAIEEVSRALQTPTRIFVIGEGRSGLMAKSFAMRLMHLGAHVFVMGETITPAIREGDILIAVSGSGKTKNVSWAAEKAKECGCRVIAFTTNLESELASYAALSVHVPAATKYRRQDEMKSVQPLGSLFDQCMHLIFDTICLRYAALQQIGHSDAFRMHSNVE
ncbi:6-phospho-3-hexuloisomerase [Ectobacillus funiculus]|uniref:6-phospho-3-hexuloisomerase n=1 Tax=Ectobacillus funiculus TaxID=137993 RepID=A0ABV5W8W2_9BACI